MKAKINQTKNCSYLFGVIAAGLFLTLAFPLMLTTRGSPAVDGQMAYATIFTGKLQYKDMTPNQDSSFSRIYNIEPLATVGIEINYPNGSQGDKVIVRGEDGGVFGNGKGVLVIPLDANNKVNFNFQVSDSPGLYRVTLRKGSDEKTVQLWVGAIPATSQNTPED